MSNPQPSPAEVSTLTALYNAGLYAELERRVRLLLDRYPDFGFGWKLLGGAMQMQRKDALHAFQKAAELSPDDAGAHYNFGIVLKNLGRLNDAVACYRQALMLKPDFVEAHSNLGNALKDLGQLDDAVAIYRSALKLKPNFAEVHNNLGTALKDLGQTDDAIASYRRALDLRPDYAEAHYNLGNVLKELGQFESAAESYHRALNLKPDFADAYSNLGSVLRDIGQYEGALERYRQALQLKPYSAVAHNNLGTALKDLGQLDDAEDSYRRALKFKPDFADAHYNLGNVLKELGHFESAADSYSQALTLKPDLADAYSNLGFVLKNSGQYESALENLHRAVDLNPFSAEAQSNLGIVLTDLGQLDDAVASYRRALEIKSNFAETHSNLLFCLSHSEAMDAQALFEEHCRFGKQFETPHRANWPQHINPRDPERCLQVGFVSADLRNHAVASFFEPVLAHLSTYPQLSLHAYSNHVIEDTVTQRLRGYLTHWHSIAGLSDDALAQKICADKIDILIDLSGHTGKNRLLTFARKPAPVQASWMGYPNTTGLHAMDYFLTDRFFRPHEQFASQFIEKFVYLPASAPFTPTKGAPPVNALPALSNGFMTFGSFNRSIKINRSVIALWSQLLRALPDSRMVLGGMPEEGKYEPLVEWFAQEGIARDRLDFHARSDMQRYLSLHHQVDICLDTFPYNGSTTTLHALWMGVPTLTLVGSAAAGRPGASILGHAGLETFVAHDPGEFVQKGLSWAGDLAALSVIRSGLRERFAQSAMGRPELVAAGLERALRIMWQRWCDDLPSDVIDASANQANNEIRPLEN